MPFSTRAVGVFLTPLAPLMLVPAFVPIATELWPVCDCPAASGEGSPLICAV